MVDIIPSNGAEEGLAHDFLRIRWATAKSLIWLPSEELLKNRDRVARHVDRVQRLVRENGVINFLLVFTSEW